MASVSIYPPGGGRVVIENGEAETVATLTARVSKELGLTEALTPFVNGELADDDTIVPDFAEVAFTQPVGQKG